jgi:hypothetical protein
VFYCVVRRLRGLPYRTASFISLVLVLALLAGCGGARYAVLPSGSGAHENVPSGHRPLQVGDNVRIDLVSGESKLGEVKEVTSRHVVLGSTGNYGYTEVAIQSNEISSIELNGGATSGSATKDIAKTLLLVVALFVVAFLASGSIGGS